jgi:hypothetical protein
MSDSYRALCSDFYVNLKLSVKMELPRGRDSVLDMFERVRKQNPTMSNFRRYREELALESPQSDQPHRWLALRNNTVRAGCVNPPELADAYAFHRSILELAPPYLTISPLDVDCVELLYGFDLAAGGNHDAIVMDALLAGSPIGSLADLPGASTISCQPVLTVAIGGRNDLQVEYKVETRATQSHSRETDGQDPISVYLTVRKFGPVNDIAELPALVKTLARSGEHLVESRLVPNLLTPLRQTIGLGNP